MTQKNKQSRIAKIGGWVLFIVPLLFGLYFFILSSETDGAEVDDQAIFAVDKLTHSISSFD